jgi:hypothetical protein
LLNVIVAWQYLILFWARGVAADAVL